MSSLHVCMCIVCVQYMWVPRRRPGLLELVMSNYGFELPRKCWKPNPGLLDKKQVFLTAETSFQLP